MRHYYTYLYKDTDGTPIYVGKGFAKRAWSHFKAKSHLGNVLRKRKQNGCTIEPIITYHTNENIALAMEIFWIAVYGRADLGRGTLFNLTDGGEGSAGAIVSAATKAKTSKALIGKKKTKTHSKNISVGKKNKPQSAEHIKAHADAIRGSKASQETKDLLSSQRKNVKKTPEHVAAMRAGVIAYYARKKAATKD